MYDRYIQDIRTLALDEDLDPKTFAARARVLEAHYRRLARKGVDVMEAERTLFEAGITKKEDVEFGMELANEGVPLDQIISRVQETPAQIRERVEAVLARPPKKGVVGKVLDFGRRTVAEAGLAAQPRPGQGKPVRKGPIRAPEFKFTSPDKPEQVFDADGKETGLRRVDGSVFKVGSRINRSGKVFEYVGNHEWKEIK